MSTERYPEPGPADSPVNEDLLLDVPIEPKYIPPTRDLRKPSQKILDLLKETEGNHGDALTRED